MLLHGSGALWLSNGLGLGDQMAERHDLSPRGAPRSFGPSEGLEFTDVFGQDGATRSPFRSIGEAETEQAEASEANSEQQASRRRRLEEGRVPPTAPTLDASGTQQMLQQLMFLVQSQNQRMNQLEAELAQARSQRSVPPSPPGLRGSLQFGGQGGLGGTGTQGTGGGRSNELPEGKVPFGINLPALTGRAGKEELKSWLVFGTGLRRF